MKKVLVGKKGFAVTGQMLFVIALVLIAGVVVATPGLISSIASLLIGTPEPCSVTPYNGSCSCEEGELRQQTLARIIPLYFCESADLLLDPNDPNFELDSINLASQTFRENFPECDSYACNEPDTEWTVGFGLVDEYQRRDVQVECWLGGQLGSRVNTIQLDLTTGSPSDMACANYQDARDSLPSGGDTPASLTVGSAYPLQADGTISTQFNKARLDMTSECDKDNGIGTITLFSSIPVVSWSLEDVSPWYSFDYCSITESDSASVTIVCDSTCPHSDFFNISVTNVVPTN